MKLKLLLLYSIHATYGKKTTDRNAEHCVGNKPSLEGSLREGNSLYMREVRHSGFNTKITSGQWPIDLRLRKTKPYSRENQNISRCCNYCTD